MKNRCQSRWGFTLAEVLISMAILAVLLTAVAAAFDLPENTVKGVIKVDGRMVERLHLAEARRVLAVARAIAAA